MESYIHIMNKIFTYFLPVLNPPIKYCEILIGTQKNKRILNWKKFF